MDILEREQVYCELFVFHSQNAKLIFIFRPSTRLSSFFSLQHVIKQQQQSSQLDDSKSITQQFMCNGEKSHVKEISRLGIVNCSKVFKCIKVGNLNA
jgi:hypothetical protein